VGDGERTSVRHLRSWRRSRPTTGESLRVSGTVHPLDKATIENEIGVNIEDHFFDEPFLDDDVAIVADDVTRLG
jgi:hypothetical protein